MPPGSPVSLDSQATATLRYIRATMEAAGTLPVPGAAGIVMGLIGIGAAVAAATPALAPHWLAVWILAAVLAAAAGAWLLVRQSARQGFTLWGAPLRKLLLCLVPGIAAGALLTVALTRAGADSLLPPVWLLLYGSALISVAATTRRLIGLMGALFVLLALLAYLLPPPAPALALVTGFGGLHLAFGILLRRPSRARQT
ncbi:MAG: hypothetical protein JO341_08755 [Gammaproteobacteria bacterium]|nr:hypothetical protein [Gammaproteobacteria bacterium]MBV9621099.1 hypothetical protein [Gammaproteobacteria bacterium]